MQIVQNQLEVFNKLKFYYSTSVHMGKSVEWYLPFHRWNVEGKKIKLNNQQMQIFNASVVLM